MDERESGRGAEWRWCEHTRQKQNSGQSEEVWHGSIAYGASREISCCAWRGRERARGLLEEELGVRRKIRQLNDQLLQHSVGFRTNVSDESKQKHHSLYNGEGEDEGEI